MIYWSWDYGEERQALNATGWQIGRGSRPDDKAVTGSNMTICQTPFHEVRSKWMKKSMTLNKGTHTAKVKDTNGQEKEREKGRKGKRDKVKKGREEEKNGRGRGRKRRKERENERKKGKGRDSEKLGGRRWEKRRDWDVGTCVYILTYFLFVSYD